MGEQSCQQLFGRENHVYFVLHRCELLESFGINFIFDPSGLLEAKIVRDSHTESASRTLLEKIGLTLDSGNTKSLGSLEIRHPKLVRIKYQQSYPWNHGTTAIKNSVGIRAFHAGGNASCDLPRIV